MYPCAPLTLFHVIFIALVDEDATLNPVTVGNKVVAVVVGYSRLRTSVPIAVIYALIANVYFTPPESPVTVYESTFEVVLATRSQAFL